MRPPTRSTRTDTLFPYTTLVRSVAAAGAQSIAMRIEADERNDDRVEVGTPCALAACGGFMNAVTIAAQRGVFFEPFEMHHAIANDARHRDADLMRGQQLKQWRGDRKSTRLNSSH